MQEKRRGRRAVPLQLKKAIAGRLQRVIDERFGSFDAFYKWAVAANHQSLADTVHNWLPPQRRWREKPEGAAVQQVDWKSCSTPDYPNLVAFCDLLGVSADFVLMGRGTPGAGATRDRRSLESDLRLDLITRLSDRAVRGAYGQLLADIRVADVDAVALLKILVTRLVVRAGDPAAIALEALDQRLRTELPRAIEAFRGAVEHHLAMFGFANLRRGLHFRGDEQLETFAELLHGLSERRHFRDRDRLGIWVRRGWLLESGDYRITLALGADDSLDIDLPKGTVTRWLATRSPKVRIQPPNALHRLLGGSEPNTAVKKRAKPRSHR